LPRCPEARGNIFDLDRSLTRKFLRTLGPRGATLADHVFAPSNGFRAAVYDSIGPLSTFMTVNSGTRWLPEPETFGSSRGGVPRKGAAGHQPQSSGWHPNGAQVPKKSRAIGRLKLLRTSVGCSATTGRHASMKAAGAFRGQPRRVLVQLGIICFWLLWAANDVAIGISFVS
jgi:hypothetical protein